MPKTQLQQDWEVRIRDFKTNRIEVTPGFNPKLLSQVVWTAGRKSVTTEVNVR